ncbi:MAG TPA: InlB B-repeat-containing protein [Alphaproteobacteria bacterium]|nr:InlB B-repeat-containing protein [Alphaproteobacteria bacterium]
MPRFARLFTFLLMVLFAGNAFAAGYSCPVYKDYSSCVEGYYLCNGTDDGCAGEEINEEATDNRCCSCQDYDNYTGRQGYYCPGSNYCPRPTYEITLRNYSNTTNSGIGYIYEILGVRWTDGSTTITSVTIPTRTNYTFAGYYTATSGGTQIIPASGVLPSPTTISSDSTYLYEHWTANTVTCSAGTYLPANATSCSACTAGSYCTGGTFTTSASNQGINSCPTNYVNGGTSVTSQSQCKFQTTGGYYVTAGGTTQISCPPGYQCPATLIPYGIAGNMIQCTGATYASGGASSCTTCPSGYNANTAVQKSSASQCQMNVPAGFYVVTANSATQTSCPGGGYYCPGLLVSYGGYGATGGLSTCPTNYTSGGSSLTAQNQCKFQTTAGTYIATANATTATTCPANNSCPAALISYGSTGVANPCTACAAVNASCSLSVVSNVCTYTTSCNEGYGNIVNNGSYNATCSANTYTITFDDAGGQGGQYDSGPLTVQYGDSLPELTWQGPPFINNYTFQGYYEDDYYGDYIYDASGQPLISEWPIPYDTTLYAQYTPNFITCNPGQYLPADSSYCINCSPGSYCPGGGYYYNASSAQGITACTTLGSNYTTSASSATSATSCYIPSTILTADKYIANANSNTVSTCSSGSYKAAHNYYYGSGAETCSSCSNKPSAASYVGTGSGANACPWSLTCSAGNYFLYNTTETSRACSTCLSNNYCTGVTATRSTSANAGLSSCPTNYDDGGTGLTAQNQCQIQTTAGTYIATANDTTLTTCFAGYYCPASLINYGSTGSSTGCPAGLYSLSGSSTCNNCAVGSYSEDASDSCIPCQGGSTTSDEGLTECDINCSNYTGYETEWDVATWDSSSNEVSNICAVVSCAAGYGISGGTCSPTMYLVTLDAQGGTGGTASVIAPYNSAMSSATMPTRTGYTFAGYYDAISGGTQYYTSSGASASVWNKTSSATLYAHWTANTYNITFDAQSGTGGTSSVSATYDSAMPSVTTPTKSGYKFIGYYDAVSGGTQYYDATGTSTKSLDKTSSTTLYAQWTLSSVTCNAGTYLPVNLETCSDCPTDSYCVGGTYNVSTESDQGIASCPENYDDGGGNLTSEYECMFQTTDGYYIANEQDTSETICPGGYYCPGTTVNYGDTGAMSPCPTNYDDGGTGMFAQNQCTFYTTAGTYIKNVHDTTTTTCPAGYYCPAAWVSYGGSGAQVQCSGATYSESGASSCTACPTNYTANTTGGKTSATQCQIQTTVGTYVATANDTSTTTCTAGYSCPASLVNYGSTGSRTQCTGATYSTSGSGTCSACPTGYTSNTDAGKTDITQCQIQTTAGNYIATANDTSTTTCPAGYYCQAVLVSYGNTGDMTQCSAGTYSVSGSSSCENCMAGSYSSDGASSCIACQNGMTTGELTPNACETTCSNSNEFVSSWATAVWNTDNSVTNNCSANCIAGYSLDEYNACAPNTYTITFNKESGSGGTDSVVVTYAAAMPSATMPTRTGYTFNGYYDSASGGTQYYTSSGASAKSWDSTTITTLYAQWTVTSITCSAGQYLPANSGSCSTCTAGSYCLGGTFSTSTSDQGLTTCPTGYMNGGTGAAAQTDCQIQTNAGYYIATANDSTQTMCAAGYYCPASLVNYGSTGVRGQCTGATYSGSGSSSCTACPTGYTNNTTAGKTLITQCQLTTTAGKYIDTPNSSTQVDCLAGYYCPAALVTYGGTGSRTQCTGATYSAAGASSCTTCPTGYDANTTAGKTLQSQCQIQTTAGNWIATANSTTQTTCTTGYYCLAALVNYGSTGTRSTCPTNYDKGGTGLSAQNQCALQTNAGYYIATAGATTQTTCTAGNYCPATLITYGSTGSVVACPTNYVNGGTGKGSITECKWTTTAGSYIKTANDITLTTCESGYYCDSASINYGSTGSITVCPTNYDKGGTGVTSKSGCKFQATAGYYIATSNATTETICAAGTYCPGGLVGWSSTGPQVACPTNYVNGGTGLSAQNQCKILTSSGFYIPTANSTSQNRCLSGYYCPSTLVTYGDTGSLIACPTGYTAGGTSLYSENQCALQTTGGKYIDTPYSTTQVDCIAGSYCPTALVTYGSTGSIIQCTGTLWSGSGQSSCTSCPGGYTANTDPGKTANTQCQIQTTAGRFIATANTTTQSKCTAGYYCLASLVNYGSTGTRTECPINYDDGGTGVTAQTGCKWQTTAGTYIATANDTTATTCTAGHYCPSTLVSYGSTGPLFECLAGTYADIGASTCTNCTIGSYSTAASGYCSACQDGTTTSVPGLSFCDAACSAGGGEYQSSWSTAVWNSDNTVTGLCTVGGCQGGYYLSDGSCVDVGTGYWSANDSITRTACPAGTMTIGYGLGADESGDCGKLLHVNDEKVYLRSDKKTTPSLNVKVDGTSYYGNMTTDTKGSLRVNSQGTQYSVYDDNM